jgi:hypothetical protein
MQAAGGRVQMRGCEQALGTWQVRTCLTSSALLTKLTP